MSMLWEKKVMVSLPTGLLARLMPELPKAHCQLMLWWTGGGGGRVRGAARMRGATPVPAPSTPVTPALHPLQPALLPNRAPSAKGQEGKKGLIGRPEGPGNSGPT